MKSLSRICRGIVSICGLLILPISTVVHAQQLPVDVTRLLAKHEVPLSTVSLEIREADSNKSIVSLNGKIPRNPASVIKIATTLSALELLGPDYQWETNYWADGPIQDGVLKGNLVMQGGGDPFLTLDRFWHHVASIRQQGVESISGDLIIDNTRFDIPNHDRDAFDSSPTRLYNVGPDAALVNFSASRFVIYPSGDEVVVFVDPPLEGLVVNNDLKPAKGNCINRNSGWQYNFAIKDDNTIADFNGAYRSSCGKHAVSRSLFSNHQYTYRLFKYLWANSGGSFDGDMIVAATPEHAQLLLTYPSEPLADIITGINKYSNNVMSRMLFLSLDAQSPDRPATLAGARQILNQWLAVNDISAPNLLIDNGSGLSRNSRITNLGLVSLLHHAWQSNYRPEFLSSLPLTALDGTMRKRLHDTGLKGRARIKTGYINGVRSMAGLVNSRSNRQYIVAMMIESNKINYTNGNEIQDAILKWIHDL